MLLYALLVGILVAPLFLQSLYVLNLLIMIGLAIILAVTNNMILRTGAWFFGHIAFFAIGAFTMLAGRIVLGLNYWMVLPLSGIMAGLSALGFGYATYRVKGIPFCILTVAFVEVVRLTFQRICQGRAIICPTPEALFGIDFASRIHYYYPICVLVALTLALMRMIDASRVGSNLTIIHDNEPLAESVGINAVRYRVMIMAVCCALAGLAGGFFAPYIKVVGDTSFGMNAQAVVFMGIVVGGMGSFWGPVVGAIFMALLPEFLPRSAAMQDIIYSSVVLVSLFYLPGGIISLPGVIKDMVTSKVKVGLSEKSLGDT
jgi:branched-chain amino acid transport system permease protein